MNPKRPAIFLDRDGVIIKEKKFLIDPVAIELFDGTIPALKAINERYLKVVVSNQSGIARGFFSAADVERFNDALSKLLSNIDISIDGWYFCPHGPEDNCECRKPKPGMIIAAEAELDIDLKDSWIIGDKSSDIAAGKAAGIKTVLVKTGYGGNEENALRVEPIHVADDILDAISYINRSAS